MRKPQRSNEVRQIVLHGAKQSYNLKRSSARRTLAITINAQGLVVHAPWAMALLQIERFVLDKADWVVEKLAAHVRIAPAAPIWQHGMVLRVLGTELTLVVGAHIGAVSMRDSVLYAPELAADELSRRVLAWYRALAIAHFNDRLARFAPLLPRQPNSLKLSNARTRWGSCTRDGVVRLNWRLIQASHAEIDYVLAHELAHLTHMNHSARFWQELERIYPDYHVPHKLLRAHGHRYHQIS